MKKQVKKLALSKETLKVLSDDDVEKIAAGASVDTCFRLLCSWYIC
jgi:hypothetical protein